MKKVILIFALSSFLCVGGCENYRTRVFGGENEIELEQGQKLLNVQWKDEDNSLWILTCTRGEDEAPKTYEFSEKSSLGLIEGKFIIIEK